MRGVGPAKAIARREIVKRVKEGWEEEGALLVSLGHRTGVGAMDGVILGRQSHAGDAAPHAAEVVSRTHFLREVWAHSPLAAA